MMRISFDTVKLLASLGCPAATAIVEGADYYDDPTIYAWGDGAPVGCFARDLALAPWDEEWAAAPMGHSPEDLCRGT